MISKIWTDEERLKIVLLLTEMIQNDIPAGNYGACVEEKDGLPVRFRPNMQSIKEVILRPAEHLEEERVSIEAMVSDQLKVIGQTPEDFFGTSLEDARHMIFGVCPHCAN